MPRGSALTSSEKNRSYRQRLRDAGGAEVLLQLPREVVSLLDDLKERQKLPSRSSALMQLIERGMQMTR